MEEETLRYPIGKFAPLNLYTESDIQEAISRIETLPARVIAAISTLNSQQLDTPYREGGWTVRQLLHHLPDSHMNAYIRFKWTLTEATPLIKAYNEKAWAETPETTGDPDASMALLKALHTKWIILLKNLKPEHFDREFIHPDTKKQVRLDRLTAMYAWHGDHHLAHITELKKRMSWK